MKIYNYKKGMEFKTQKELIEIAKNLGIKCHTCKNKRELIDEINEKKSLTLKDLTNY